jgi:hypothetical protein
MKLMREELETDYRSKFEEVDRASTTLINLAV